MERKEALKKWSDYKFGLFIHWGLYALLEKGEWVMYNKRIPVKEYEKLAGQFNPVAYNAREWVEIAQKAGMKYIIITTKHHDGFSMFKTDVDSYNIVDATPFGRDILAELAQACREGGIKLGFYYSHVREWRHPMAQSLEKKRYGELYGNYGNYWDYPDEYKKNLQTYIDEFDKPQLKELLSNYGDVLTIWFDTPSMIRPDQAEQMQSLIYGLQPDCLINSRIGEDVECDYMTLGDNEIPSFGSTMPWETPMTLGANGSWGYSGDGYFGDGDKMILSLADVASKGGNLLLNVGPDARGRIPEKAREQLEKAGDWMSVNGEAIYGNKKSPFLQQPTWGRVTAKDNHIYITVVEKQERFVLNGLYSPPESCRRLSDGAECRFETTIANGLHISLPDEKEKFPVIVLTFHGEPVVADTLETDEKDSVYLPAALADIHRSPGSGLSLVGGVTKKWLDAADYLSWTLNVRKSGEYRVRLIIKNDFLDVWEFGHMVTVTVGDNAISGVVEDDGRKKKGFEAYQERMIDLGLLTIDSGKHICTLKPDKINGDMRLGLTFLGMELCYMPVN